MGKHKRAAVEHGYEAGEANREARRTQLKMQTELEERGLDVLQEPGGPQKSDNVLPSVKRTKTLDSLAPPPVAARERSRSRDGTVRYTKPPFSFSHIIKEAILKSPHKRLLLHEIYESILDSYPYFRTAGDGWKNSVRHNLSINSMFCKIPKDILDNPNDAGGLEDSKGKNQKKKKGCYWILQDITSLAQERLSTYEEHRRKSLAHLFATSGLPAGPPDCIRILPFTHVPTVMDIGRRHSDSYLYSSTIPSTIPPMAVNIEELRRRPDMRQQVDQLQGSRARSPYSVTAEVNEKGAPLMEIQPLSIETAFDGMEMSWLATSPQMTVEEDQNPESIDLQSWIGMMDWGNLLPQDQVVRPQVRKASTVGPGTLPRRPIKDIWFGETSSPGALPEEQVRKSPAQFRQ